jgi:hypothetical protein
MCINPSTTKLAKKFTTAISAKEYCGFTTNGPADRYAEFFDKVMTGEISTRKNILDIYYTLAHLKWTGEGYGLSYYPRKKQDKTAGSYMNTKIENTLPIQLPAKILGQFDTINQFKTIHTDNLFVAHAGIALRKYVYLYTQSLPYEIEFFKKGHHTRKN